MYCKNVKVIFDPYILLPSYGENNISLSFIGKNLEINVFFDSRDGSVDSVIKIIFRKVCFHKLADFPGIGSSNTKAERYNDITSLIEFEQSDFKRDWEIHFSNLSKLKHFQIFFTSANYHLEVICEDVEIQY